MTTHKITTEDLLPQVVPFSYHIRSNHPINNDNTASQSAFLTWERLLDVPMELIHSTYNTMPARHAVYATPAPFLLSFVHLTRSSSSIGHHILHITPVLARNMLLHLLLRQPLEVSQPIHIARKVRLSSHNASFHEERSHSLMIESS